MLQLFLFHRIIHKEEVMLCPHCEYRSRSGITHMRFHLVTKHNDHSLGEALIYNCRYCDYKTCKKKQLAIHQKSHEIKAGMCDTFLCFSHLSIHWQCSVLPFSRLIDISI